MAPAWRDPAPLLKAKSLAIIGASPGARWVEIFLDQIPGAGFRGPIWPIHPAHRKVGDLTCYPDLRAAPGVPEHVLLHVSAERTLAVLEEAAAAGVKGATVYTTGWAETDDAGKARQEALKKLVDRTGLKLCGPNCLGFMSVREGLVAYPLRVLDWLKPGSLGAVFQSGALLYPFVRAVGERGAGFSYLVSCGNEVGLDAADYMKFLIEDPETRVIAMLLEGVRSPDKFRAALEMALAAGKPVAIMKVGRTERARESALTHTGALAGSERVFDALCRRYAVARCESLEQLVETSRALTQAKRPAGRRAAFLVFSGSLRSHLLDNAPQAGIEMAQPGGDTLQKLSQIPDLDARIANPLDCGVIQATQAKYMDVGRLLLADPGVDLLLVQEHPPDPKRGRSGAALKAIADASAKPVMVFSETGYSCTDYTRAFSIEAGVPLVQGAESGMRAAGHLIAFAQLQGAKPRQVRVQRPPAIGAQLGAGLHGLGTIGDDLERQGIRVIARRMARTADEAVAAAHALGYPVALKIESPDIAHKSDAGGVRLSLGDEAQLRAAWSDMHASIAASMPEARVHGALVARMAPPGLEMSVGVQRDPQFGLALMVGLGGVWIEVFDDVSLRLLPVDEVEAREMIGELKARALLGAFRGSPPRDAAALAAAMASLSRVALAYGERLASLEINPLILHDECRGASAVDARLVLREARP